MKKNPILYWLLIVREYVYITVNLILLFFLTGCLAAPVRILSNPSRAYFTIYNKNGQVIESLSPDLTIFDARGQVIISSEPIALYRRTDYGPYLSQIAIPSSIAGDYTVYWFPMEIWFGEHQNSGVIFYNKDKNPIRVVHRKESPYVELYDRNDEKVISSDSFMLYVEKEEMLIRKKEQYCVRPSSFMGSYTMYPISVKEIRRSGFDDLYDKDNNKLVGELSKNKIYTVTPQLVRWDNSYSHVKFDLPGFPSQTVNKIKDGEIFADFTNATPSKTAPSPAQPWTRTNEPGIEQALSKAIQSSTSRVPKNATIAVIPITTSNSFLTDFLTGESEYLLVRHGFSVVDRAQLDRIRTEQRLQLSDEIDATTISSIGRFSGAEVIITGRIDGSGSLQRLRLQVLDVQTADVIGTASEQFGESQPNTNPQDIESAVSEAIEHATKSISQNARLAIVDVITDSGIKAFITGEAEYTLKNKGFRVVDRAQLDRIRSEQSLQRSNEFDNRTAANIGKLAGADYLITIQVDGRDSLTRLRWRVLNTQTAMVIGTASVHFVSEGVSSTSTISAENARKTAISQATANVNIDDIIAVVQFSSNDNAVRAENVVYSIENDLVEKGFRVVSRSQLDTIRAEQRYQRSGEVDSRTAVDLGKLAGAKYIVTGSIDGAGSLKRYRLRVLDTETAEVVGTASVSVQ